MRVLLIALMIALLPLRGWVGNAMAAEMASQQVVMAQSAGASENPGMSRSTSVDRTMLGDCPMTNEASASEAFQSIEESTDNTASGASGSYCSGCNTCELCLALASFNWAGMPDSSFTPHAEPLARGTHFNSADLSFGLKPPIS